jgi:GTP-binding nuclear protein Ran
MQQVGGKLVLVGDGGVGKTTFIRRHQTGEFIHEYIPTAGVVISQVSFHTTQGLVVFEVWNTAGQEILGGLREAYYLESDCAMVMFDLTAPASYRNAATWYKDVIQVCPTIPVVLVGNKADVADRPIHRKNVTLHKKHEIPYYSVSAKTNYHFELPFLELARNLTGSSDLQFTTAPVIVPPEVVLDPALAQQYDDELAVSGKG